MNDINELIESSKDKIINLREVNSKLYDIIIKFCVDNSLILSNYNINLINKYERVDNPKDFNFIILSNKPKEHAISLCNIISKEYSKFVTALIFLERREISITVNRLRIIKLQLFFNYGVNLIEKLNLKTVNVLSNKKMYYTSDIYELFIRTHELYNPDNMTTERDAILDKLMQPYTKKSIADNIYKLYINKKLSKDDPIIKIFNAIDAETFVDIELVVLSIMKNKISVAIHSKYNKYIGNKLNEIFTGHNIEVKRGNFYLFDDFRLQKINYNIKKDNKKILTVSTYNFIDYEIIPIIEKKNKLVIPHSLVKMRFMLLDLITMQLYDKFYNNNLFNMMMSNISSIYNSSQNDIIGYYGIYRAEILDRQKYRVDIYRPN